PYYRPAGEPIQLKGEWTVTFVAGGPELPEPFSTASLGSWTTQADPRTQRFAGTARYSIRFNGPPIAADSWLLDLGDVRESATVLDTPPRVPVNCTRIWYLFRARFSLCH